MRGFIQISEQQNDSQDVAEANFSDGTLALWSQDSVFQNEGLVISIQGTISSIEGQNVGESNEAALSRLYRKFGDDFYKRTDGLHLILLYEIGKRKLVISNNRYQASQLYYCQMGSKLYFAKSMKWLLEMSGTSSRAHLGAILNFLSNGFNVSDQTQIQNVKKLLPTKQIVVQSGKVEVRDHWKEEVPFDRRPIGDIQDELVRYETLYRQGLERFLDQKQPRQVGTLLSGGHDTSWVAIQYAQLKRKPLNAYTITFPGWAFNEEAYARNISEKFNARFCPIPFSGTGLDSIVDLIRSAEEPVVGSSLPLHCLAEKAGDDCDLMLGGDGGDTLWGEYFPVAEFHKYIKHFSLGMRRAVHGVSKKLALTTDWERFWELEHVASLFATQDFYKDFIRRLCTYRHFTDSFQKDLLDPQLFSNVSHEPSSMEIQFNEQNFSQALIEGKLLNAFYTYQSFHTTKSMERFGMEFYLPTIQKDVIQFITNLPDKWVNGGTTLHRLINSKAINRRFHKLALSKYLKQEEIYNRSFDIPWTAIFKERPFVLDLLKDRLKKRGWYQARTIDRVFDEFKNQNQKEFELLELKNHGYRIFTLLSLEIWASEYIDGKGDRVLGHGKLEEYLAV